MHIIAVNANIRWILEVRHFMEFFIFDRLFVHEQLHAHTMIVHLYKRPSSLAFICCSRDPVSQYLTHESFMVNIQLKVFNSKFKSIQTVALSKGQLINKQ